MLFEQSTVRLLFCAILMTLVAFILGGFPARTPESSALIDSHVWHDAIPAISTTTQIAILLVPILFVAAKHSTTNTVAVARAVSGGVCD